MIISFIIISVFILYSILILYYWQSWKSIPDFVTSPALLPVKISVIVPARNEEHNIGNLLNALQAQSYPKERFEIIVVDDHSSDKTTSVVLQYAGVNLIQLKDDEINSYKKKAIETGISAAAGELVITTDADCIPPVDWLNTIVSFKEKTDAGFIVAPVVFNPDSSLIQIFQAMDFMVLQGITGASVYKKVHSMCNGANLAYERKLFYEVNGFAGIDHIASGDDMLLMHKIAKKYPGRIHYLKSKNAIVSTRPMPTWKDFLSQRIRWASKATHYDDKRIFGVLLLVYLFNLSFVVLFISGFWSPFYWLILAALWIAKTFVELPFIYSLTGFFDKRFLVKYFFGFQPLHIIYTVCSGLLGQFGKYEWKGRRVK